MMCFSSVWLGKHKSDKPQQNENPREEVVCVAVCMWVCENRRTHLNSSCLLFECVAPIRRVATLYGCADCLLNTFMDSRYHDKNQRETRRKVGRENKQNNNEKNQYGGNLYRIYTFLKCVNCSAKWWNKQKRKIWQIELDLSIFGKCTRYANKRFVSRNECIVTVVVLSFATESLFIFFPRSSSNKWRKIIFVQRLRQQEKLTCFSYLLYVVLPHIYIAFEDDYFRSHSAPGIRHQMQRACYQV